MAGALIEKKPANLLSRNVGVKPVVGGVLSWATLGLSSLLFGWLRRQWGGLWVGGTFFVYDDKVQFSPNGLNEAVQRGDMALDLPWSQLLEVSWRPGVLTSIIELRHVGGVEAVRCFGSKRLAAQIETLRSGNVG